MKRILTMFILMVLLIPSKMYANFMQADTTVTEVYAQELDSQDVKVFWSWNEINLREAYEFSLYRRNNIVDGDVVLLAENLTDTVFIDTAWNNVNAGLYQWGVEVQNATRKTHRGDIINVDFEDGKMPEGWITTSEQVYPTTSEWSVAQALMYTYFPADGQYSAFSNGTTNEGLHYDMITSAIDLKTAISANLSFDYANLEFFGGICVFNVKVGTSQEGPWETIFTTGEDYTNTWTNLTLDLSEYLGQTIYLAFENEDYSGYGIGVDNIVLTAEVPNIVWSNILEKDMYTTVEITVTSEVAEGLEGTRVSFINLIETGNDYEITLDDTGYYQWTEFRKGTYEYTVYSDEYESCATKEVIDIFDETSLECVLEEIIIAAKDLYVSPTGFAKWEGEDVMTRAIESYTVSLNGVEEATVTEKFYQHENITAGETYTTKVVANYKTGDSEAIEYTWTCVACDEYDGVLNFDATYSDGSAVLTWRFPDGDYKTDELYYDNGANFNLIGQQGGGNFFWGVMFPADDMMPGTLTKVMMFDGSAHTGDIYIYLGGDTIPETLITTQAYECTAVNDYVDFKLLEPVTIDGTQNLWIVFGNNDNSAQVAPASDVNSKNGGWLSIDGEQWYTGSEVLGIPLAWQVRGFIERGADPIGLILYRDGELLENEIITSEIYSDPITEIGTYKYSFAVVYNNYAIACPQTFDFEYLSINENANNTMSVYPNPVKDNLTVTAENMTSIIISNALGQIVLEQNVVSDNEIISMTQYEAGVYFVRIITETGTAVERITVVR